METCCWVRIVEPCTLNQSVTSRPISTLVLKEEAFRLEEQKKILAHSGPDSLRPLRIERSVKTLSRRECSTRSLRRVC